MSSLATLWKLLQVDPSKQSTQDASQEATLLEEIAVQHSSSYEFVSSSSSSSKAFGDLFDALVTHRLLNEEWLVHLRADHRLRVLQCIRLLSRDSVLRQRFIKAGAVQILCGIFQIEATAHFGGSVSQFQIETLTEIASIIKRLAGDEGGLAVLVQCSAHRTLTQLLSSNDPAVLPLVLVAQIGFAAHREHYHLVADSNSLEILLRIVQQYDLPFKRLAADLLALLSRRESVVLELVHLNGLCRIVGQLQTGDINLTQSLLRVVCYMATDMRALQEMYQVGIIPVLVSLLSAAVKDMQSDPSSNVIPGGSARITQLQLVCTALTRISEADEMAYQIRQCNGVTLLGKMLLAEPDRSDRRGEHEGAGASTSGSGSTTSHPQGSHPPRHQGSVEIASLKTYVFRALRYLFSMERNRKVFKRLFPPDLFAMFIDVGHYHTALAEYSELVAHFEDLTDKQQAGVSAALDDISADRDGTLRVVRGYVILEMLGKGAYGAVYKARRARGDLLVALKELPLTDIGIFGATDQERSAGVAHLNKEVQILSSLNHPNIVQYYESFLDSDHLYICMELVEGVSLLDHINSLSGKGKRMPESDVWQVLIATCLALNYIHVQKKIVHRDLTPGNIVLGQGSDGLRQTKIADFGLAKSLTGSVCAHSVVGTMPYTCPEIIQQERYTEKADVWSLGCVLYHIMMLRPPFDGTNPLSVASKIVEGSYPPVADPPESSAPPYSTQLKQLVKVMMTVDPARRPGIEDVGSLIVGQLMGQLERVSVSEQRLARALTMERAQRRGDSANGSLYSPAIHRIRQGGGLNETLPQSSSPQSSPPPGMGGTPGPGSRGAAGPRVSRGGEHEAPSHLGMTVRLGELKELHLSERASSPEGASTPTGRGGSSGAFGATGGSLAATAGGTRVVSIPTSRLRPVVDPLSGILSQLHKVMWVEQLPPGLARDPRRRCVEAFRRLLFAPGSSQASLKLHLAKLIASEGDLIRDTTGRPVDFGAVPLGDNRPDATSAGGLSYDQLGQTIEGLLADKGYYSSGGTGAVIPEQELLDQLPPPSFNGTVPRLQPQ